MAYSEDTVNNGAGIEQARSDTVDPFGDDRPVFRSASNENKAMEHNWQRPATSTADAQATALEHIDLTGDDPVAVVNRSTAATESLDQQPQAVSTPSDVATVPETVENATIRDLRTTRRTDVLKEPSTHYGLGRRWGSQWSTAAQGWVTSPSGEQVWRPVISTTETLSQWDTDTYLGVVTAEVAIDASPAGYTNLGETLARARQIGIDGLTEEAIDRGAHAVIGVAMTYTPLGDRLLITMTGTAVTLREKAPQQPRLGY